MFTKQTIQQISPAEIHPNARPQFDFSRQEVREIKNYHAADGNPNHSAFIWFECLDCKQGHMIERHCAIKKVSPYCKSCAAKHKTPNASPITPDMIPESVRFSFDFSRQEFKPIGKRHSRQWHILHICPRCGSERFVVRGVAIRRLTPYCHPCCSKYTRWGKPKGNGFFINEDGYRMIDVERFYPEQKEYIKHYLATPSNPHSYWFAEHRVIALLAFGPWSIARGSVIRHRNGDKLNNDLANLLPGSDSDNKLDHYEAVLLMQQWRFLALFLLRHLVKI